jgi:hypothetical protein
MILILSYDRRTQKLRRPIEQFPDERWSEARKRRLDLQLELPSEEGRYEVVLLEASSLEAIRETHARYFAQDAHELVQQAKAEVARTAARLDEVKEKRSRRSR